jgi:hypothetical protein
MIKNRMRGKKEIKKIELNISNRFFYSAIFFAVIIFLGVGVTAFRYDNLGTPSVFGHSIGELAPPNGNEGMLIFSGGSWVATTNVPPSCSGDLQALKYDSATRTWGCGGVGFECNWVDWSPLIPETDCYIYDTCYVESDCATDLCPYYLDGYAMPAPPEWQIYATPVQQIFCEYGAVTQIRYASICPSDATSACGYIETSG